MKNLSVNLENTGVLEKDIMQYMSLSQTQLSIAISNIQQKIAFIKET